MKLQFHLTGIDKRRINQWLRFFTRRCDILLQ